MVERVVFRVGVAAPTSAAQREGPGHFVVIGTGVVQSGTGVHSYPGGTGAGSEAPDMRFIRGVDGTGVPGAGYCMERSGSVKYARIK